MPEGDTIFRTATSLRTWMNQRIVDQATAKDPRLALGRVVGLPVTEVVSRGKHLLIWFGDHQWCLHTHMRMTGSWHLYTRDARWQKPSWQANLTLTAGERSAVCFNAPVVRLLTARQVASDPVLGLVGSLGPDLLSRAPAPVVDIVASIRSRYSTLPIGDVLLDQSIASGIGNIYRCETLFMHNIDPATPVGQVDDATLGSLYETARELLLLNARSPVASRRFGREGQTASVYDRAGLPCRVCGSPIAVRHFGRDGRLLFWCRTCQPPFVTVRDQT